MVERGTRKQYLEYKPWYSMWHRCTNPKNKDFKRYMGKVPPEAWRDFFTFVRDIGPRPDKTYTLERIDNNLPYGPLNCRWATRAEQQRNTSQNRWFILGDEKLCLADLAIRIGVSDNALRGRLDKLNWPLAKAAGAGWQEVPKANN